MKKNTDFEQRVLIKKTLSNMTEHINKLELQKQSYIDAARRAKQRGLTSQYNLAVAGLKMTQAHQQKAYEMQLNFEIVSQMKDMTMLVTEFLGGMSLMSKEMSRLVKSKDFKAIQKEFENAMKDTQTQSEQIDTLMNASQAAFDTQVDMSKVKIDDAEIEKLIDGEAAAAESNLNLEIEKELEEISKRKLGDA